MRMIPGCSLRATSVSSLMERYGGDAGEKGRRERSEAEKGEDIRPAYSIHLLCGCLPQTKRAIELHESSVCHARPPDVSAPLYLVLRNLSATAVSHLFLGCYDILRACSGCIILGDSNDTGIAVSQLRSCHRKMPRVQISQTGPFSSSRIA